MVKFSEHFLDKLAPRSQTFEIKEASDFAIRVFPNGSKTWVYIHTVDQSVNRQTLGIYPQMSIKQAHDALQMLRKSVDIDPGVEVPAEDFAATRHPEQVQVAKNKLRLPSRFALALVIGALCVGGLLTLQANEDLSVVSPPTNHPRGLAEQAAPVAVPDSPAQTEVARSEPAGESPDPGPVADRPVSPPDNQAGESAPQDAPNTARADLPSPAPQVSATVKRAQFTTGIDDREPIDRIAGVLPAWNLEQGARQIFFFSEVRGLGDRGIRHRWELNGEIVSEIPFEVKSSWRWRVFSSKNILPTMAGQWRVSIVDDRDKVLHSQVFTLETGHLMSALTSPDHRPHEGPDR